MKSPNSVLSKSSCQSPKKTRRNTRKGLRREVDSVSMILVTIIIRRSFTNSLDSRARSISAIKAFDSFSLFGSMNLFCSSNFLPVSELQRRARPSKYFSYSVSSSNDSNVDNNTRRSISGFSLKTYFSAVLIMLREKKLSSGRRLGSSMWIKL